MCGICGQYNYASEMSVQRSILQKMTEKLYHRGPDAAGYYVHGLIGLGHRRLKIIDLSGGTQPMFNEDGSLVVVFNGEIYNYQALRKELLTHGHVFQSMSDTEVLLHGFEQWGNRLVERLRGMFAFAIWNSKNSELFIARDRLGIKPLYFYYDEKTFLFASEIKAILQAQSINRELDFMAIDDYLTYMYIPAPKTIYKSIRKLPAGHFMHIGSDGMKQTEYWDISFEPAVGTDENQIIENIIDRLRESIQVRMISDVPLGAFLSGGIDSSAVVGLMSTMSQHTVKTSSIGFRENGYDELCFARQVAKKYKTHAYEKTVEADAAKILDELVWFYDEPFADSSMVPTYYLSQVARENVTVCLSGDGGDENFAGYRRYRYDYLENQIRAFLPFGFRKPVFGCLGYLYPKADWLPRMFRAKTLFANLSLPAERAYFNSMRWFSDAMKFKLFVDPIKRELKGYESFSVMQSHFNRTHGWDALSRIQYVDIKTYLVDDILTKVDRASMAHSLEVRVPLLDHEFMEYVASIPFDYKLRSGVGKYILKKALKGIVPDDILYRPKQGFVIPLADWLRTRLKPVFEERVFDANSFSKNLFNMAQVEIWWNRHQRGVADYSFHMWALLIFESWAKRFIL